MQTIVLLLLVNVPFPPFANLFFIGCMQIAAIDIFSGEDWFEENMKFKETTAFSDIFENAEI